MTVVATWDIMGLTPAKYRSIIDDMGVESKSAAGLYLHLTAQIDGGYRITEIWGQKEGFESFLQERLFPAAEALGIQRETAVSVQPLHNLFAPRLNELPPLVDSLPGGPNAARTGKSKK